MLFDQQVFTGVSPSAKKLPPFLHVLDNPYLFDMKNLTAISSGLSAFFEAFKSPINFRKYFCDPFDVKFIEGEKNNPHQDCKVYAYKTEGDFTDEEKDKIKRYAWTYVSTTIQKKAFYHICFKFYRDMISITMFIILLIGWACVFCAPYPKLFSFTIDILLVIPASTYLYRRIPKKYLYSSSFSVKNVKLYYGKKQITEFNEPKPYEGDAQKDFFAIYIAFLVLFSFQVSALLS